MRIGIVTTYDLGLGNSWQPWNMGQYGSGYFLCRALESVGVSLVHLGPLGARENLWERVKQRYFASLHGKTSEAKSSVRLLRALAQEVEVKLEAISKNSTLEMLLCPQSCRPICYLQTKIPIYLYTDAPIISLVNYYPHLKNPTNDTLSHIREADLLALQKCSGTAFASSWAKNKALSEYVLNPIESKRLAVIPKGPNLSVIPAVEEVVQMLSEKSRTRCKLLFFGMDWRRKGGDIAVKLSQALIKRGFDHELHILGCDASVAGAGAFEQIHFNGYTNKFSRDGESVIRDHLASSHYLIMPSRAEAFGISAIEANAFGVPVIASCEGGLAEIVENDQNGWKFDLHSADLIREMCDKIEDNFSDNEAYRRICLSTRERFSREFAWDKIVQKIMIMLG